MKNQSELNRREFLKQSVLVSAALGAGSSVYAGDKNNKGKTMQFKMCINPGNIGLEANQTELLDYAIQYKYQALMPYINDLQAFDKSTLAAIAEKMQQHNISWGSTNLPLDFRQDKKTFKEGLSALPGAAATLERVGASRMNTWIMPTNNELSYRENFALHATRLKECAKIVGQKGVRLGLEYVGPKTLMARDKFSFIRSMKEVRELIAEIDEPNVGVVLDSFHWYCANDTEADILALENKDIITVDVNDARADLSRDDQVDNTRELPLATGVIDLSTFMGALAKIGYDGPIRSEPFNKKLNAMNNDDALAANTAAMKATFALVT